MSGVWRLAFGKLAADTNLLCYVAAQLLGGSTYGEDVSLLVFNNRL
jgi:hypothetical protein